MLEINEIFGPTIQGEGKLVGTPSIFIRFGKCNFKCVGFGVEYETPSGIKKCACDSYYAIADNVRSSSCRLERLRPSPPIIRLAMTSAS